MTNLHKLPYRSSPLTNPSIYSRCVMFKFEIRHANVRDIHLLFMKGFPYVSEVMGEEKPVSSVDIFPSMLDNLDHEEGYQGKESVK